MKILNTVSNFIFIVHENQQIWIADLDTRHFSRITALLTRGTSSVARLADELLLRGINTIVAKTLTSIRVKGGGD